MNKKKVEEVQTFSETDAGDCMDKKIINVGEVENFTDLCGMTIEEIYQVKEWRIELEFVGEKCNITYDATITGKEIEEYCKKNYVNPTNFADLFLMLDALSKKSILNQKPQEAYIQCNHEEIVQ